MMTLICHRFTAANMNNKKLVRLGQLLCRNV